MGSLEKWQQAFTHSLFNDLSTELANSFNPLNEEAKQQRFAIYQNNVFYSLTTALGDLYPVIKKLVGDDFFTGTASYYLRESPPKQAAMVFFAEDFPAFLTTFEHTRQMPYLADVARLELARHRAYHAKDAQALNAQDFSTIDPESLACSTLELHSSLHLVNALYPIFSIWHTNQEANENSAETIDLNEPQQVLVVRPIYDVVVYNIDIANYCFIDLLQSGCQFQEAVEKTASQYHDFNIAEAIHFLINEQLIIGISSP